MGPEDDRRQGVRQVSSATHTGKRTSGRAEVLEGLDVDTFPVGITVIPVMTEGFTSLRSKDRLSLADWGAGRCRRSTRRIVLPVARVFREAKPESGGARRERTDGDRPRFWNVTDRPRYEVQVVQLRDSGREARLALGTLFGAVGCSC